MDARAVAYMVGVKAKSQKSKKLTALGENSTRIVGESSAVDVKAVEFMRSFKAKKASGKGTERILIPSYSDPKTKPTCSKVQVPVTSSSSSSKDPAPLS